MPVIERYGNNVLCVCVISSNRDTIKSIADIKGSEHIMNMEFVSAYLCMCLRLDVPFSVATCRANEKLCAYLKYLGRTLEDWLLIPITEINYIIRMKRSHKLEKVWRLFYRVYHKILSKYKLGWRKTVYSLQIIFQ